jgi:glutaredoxin-related protein
MRRQQNTYTIVDTVTQLLCIDGNGVAHAAIFPTEYYAEIRKSQWSFKGKNGIVDSFGVSIASFFADVYGYKNGQWKRVEQNEDYFRRNYTSKFVPIFSFPAKQSYGDVYYERVKWKSKYKCEALKIIVTKYGHPTEMSVTILVNTYLRASVPKYCNLKTLPSGYLDIVCLDGMPLRRKILSAAMGTDDVREYISETCRPNILDFRIDPNDNSYISTDKSHIRRHYVDEGVLIEVRDRSDRTSATGWRTCDDFNKSQFRLPATSTKYEDRVSFVLVQEGVADVINDIWYDSSKDEFIVDDLHVAEPRQLKYLVCDVNSIAYKDVYFAPKHTERYANALKASSSDELKGKRRLARIENALDSQSKMFTKPKYLKLMHIRFNTVGFNTTVYGGVGVFYLDARPEAMYKKDTKNSTASQRKDTRGASSIHDPTLPELAGS